MVQVLIDQCRNFGINHVVISPGSRNAPLIIAFDNHPEFKCYSIPDERSAAFYALGMARQLNEPVAIICTSGTAVLNYAPALTEAFYQEIPVIAITADRPPELIDQEDGQTIRQENVFANHIRFSTSLTTKEDQQSIAHGKEQIDMALSVSLSFPKGPVHINIPFEEPLYDFEEKEIIDIDKPAISCSDSFPLEQEKNFLSDWQQSEKVIILVGVSTPNKELNRSLTSFAKQNNAVIFAPATANIQGENTFNTIETLFFSTFVNSDSSLTPDILITIGGPVVSKAAKQYLRKYKPKFHYDIDVNPAIIDTYKALSEKITCSPMEFISRIVKDCDKKPSAFLDKWQDRNIAIKEKTKNFTENVKWSDISIYTSVFDRVPLEINLHLANSTPVRYAELFNKHPKVNYYCNRGTSGIDGCTSTAAGAALVSNNPTILITGDMSFFYDSNAFWNNHVPNNLKVILINNGGGNIFKVIRGPENTNQLESLFVTQQSAKAEKLCEAFGVDYLSCNNHKGFKESLLKLFETDKCTVLEAFTPSNKSAQTYRDIFAEIKSL